MNNDFIYFDNAATTFPKPEIVYDFMNKFYRENGVNAGRGSYKKAKIASDLINDTRKRLASLINLDNKDKVIFTPSATIALNEILGGLDFSSIKNIYVTEFEHNAVMRTLNYKKKINEEIKINIIPFNNETFELDEATLKVMFAKDNPDLIIISHVSNVTGYILPIKKIFELAQKYKPVKVLDCAQSLGLIDININEIEVDFLVFAGHKTLYGPFGASGYFNLYEGVFIPYIVGGTGSDSTNLDMPEELPIRYEAGSYNVQAIAGLNVALKWIDKVKAESIFNHKKELTDYLVSGISELDNIELYVPKDKSKHIGIVSFNICGIPCDEIASILDEDFNIAVRAGHHCAPNIGEFLGGEALKGNVRVSLGYFNKKAEIDTLIEALEEISEV